MRRVHPPLPGEGARLGAGRVTADAARGRLLAASWIPHWALLAGQAAHGASWLLLIVLGLRGLTGASFPGLAWVHLVALGYLTLIALAVLIHVLHGMLDLTWVAGRVARWSLLPFALGAYGLVAGFWLGRPPLIAAGASVLAAALAVYLALAAATLARFRPDEETSVAVMRAFAMVLGWLAATAGLGVAMAWALAGHGGAWWLAVAPRLHAHAGAVGWLSLLVVGVSMHTVKPITGGKSDARWKHVVSSSLLLVALLAILAGFAAASRAALWAGAVAGVAGVALYLADLAGILARARVPHRPPQAFLAASGLYFLGAALVGVAVLAGRAEWAPAYAYLALIGWLGQMVNGHLYHIGVRVLATVARGEDDETRPGELLAAPLSWASWAALQAAVVVGTGALMAGAGTALAAAGGLGLVGWAMMGANVVHAWRAASRTVPWCPRHR